MFGVAKHRDGPKAGVTLEKSQKQVGCKSDSIQCVLWVCVVVRASCPCRGGRGLACVVVITSSPSQNRMCKQSRRPFVLDPGQGHKGRRPLKRPLSGLRSSGFHSPSETWDASIPGPVHQSPFLLFLGRCSHSKAGRARVGGWGSSCPVKSKHSSFADPV